jgi:pilus assembly protein FimV
MDGAEAPPTTTANLTANSVFGATGGQSVDTTASSMATDFSQASISAIDAEEGVDPVAEADVYMAYGRDAQAEEILLDALKTDPTRTAIHVKLLEIYAGRKNNKQFETLASDLYAQTGGVGADWEKAAAMGMKLDPANPLYGGSTAAEKQSIQHRYHHHRPGRVTSRCAIPGPCRAN